MNRRERADAGAQAGRTGGNPKAAADRRHLLTEDKAGLMVALSEFRTAGSWRDDMVLVIVDTRDAIGSRLAETCGFDLADGKPVRALGQVPTVFLVMPATSVSELLAESQPSLALVVSAPPPLGMVRAVIVGSGAVALMLIQDEAIEFDGDA